MTAITPTTPMQGLPRLTRRALALAPGFAQVDREIATRHHGFQDPQASMTLAEGLAEYYASGELYQTQMSARTRRWFKAHDASHVLFGCATTPEQESVVDAWIAFGTTWEWAEYIGEIRYPEQRDRILHEIFADIGIRRTAFLVVATAPHVLEVRRRAALMHQLWPFYGHERYHDYRLADLRREFNIELLCS